MTHRTSIGLDVHARSIVGAAFIPETGEIATKPFAYNAAPVAEWAKSLPQPAWCAYESGPAGFDLKRKLEGAGVERVVGAVSKMFRPAGDRVKTDKRDAVFLARMLAVGNVVECAMPDEAAEAARDLARMRADCREDLMRARHRLSKFPLRKGVVYDKGKTAWTKAHGEWLASISFDDPCEQLVYEEYCDDVRALARQESQCGERRRRPRARGVRLGYRADGARELASAEKPPAVPRRAGNPRRFYARRRAMRDRRRGTAPAGGSECVGQHADIRLATCAHEWTCRGQPIASHGDRPVPRPERFGPGYLSLLTFAYISESETATRQLLVKGNDHDGDHTRDRRRHGGGAAADAEVRGLHHQHAGAHRAHARDAGERDHGRRGRAAVFRNIRVDKRGC